MFSRFLRMSRPIFSRVFSFGVRHHTPYFNIIHNKNEERRIAVVVSKKIYKKAVDRNQLRRQIRAVIEENLTTQGEYIFIVKKELSRLTKKERTKAVVDAIGVLKRKG